MAKGIHLPVLVIHGDADAIVPIEASGKRAAELIPNAQLKIYPNGPHGLFYTHRDELNRDIAAFASDGRIALADAA
jgi:pimeloyl-ACP methyl ester carboxylesterase